MSNPDSTLSSTPATTRETDATTLGAAKAPVGPGVVSLLGLLAAAVVTGLGVVAGHDALAWSGIVSGDPWTRQLVRAVDGRGASPWLVPIAVVLVLLGLWLLVLALRPRPRPATQLRAQTGVYLRTRDVARLARGAAESVGGVLSADTQASRRAVDIVLRTTGDDATQAAVQEAVTHRLSALDRSPTVTVKVRGDEQQATAPSRVTSGTPPTSTTRSTS